MQVTDVEATMTRARLRSKREYLTPGICSKPKYTTSEGYTGWANEIEIRPCAYLMGYTAHVWTVPEADIKEKTSNYTLQILQSVITCPYPW